MTTSTEFKIKLEDQAAPVAVDFSSDSSTLLVAFGGIQGALGMPPFEFFNLTSTFATQKIYVRDLEQAWYHCGLPGLTDNIDGIARLLKGLVEARPPKRVIMCGNSMGGYAALLFGALLEPTVVQAFSPQTFLSSRQRLLFWDRRWPEQIRKLHRALTARREYFDLQTTLARPGNAATRFHIHYSLIDRLDKLHAERLRCAPNVTLHPYRVGGHGLIKHLRASGLLKKILLESLE